VFKELLKRYGFLNGEKLSIVIGNHDIFGGVQKAEDIFTFPEKCKSINYENSVKNFVQFFPEAFNNCTYLSSSGYFPFAKKLDDLLIIGLNSVSKYSKLSNTFGSNGEVNASQFAETVELLKSMNEESNIKIVLIHHHFNRLKNNARSTFGSIWSGIEKQTLKLRNKRRLFNLFKEFKIDLILHGHVHESREYYRKGIRFINAGATVKNDKHLIKINFIEIESGKINLKIKNIELPKKIKTNTSLSLRSEIIKLVSAELSY
jgi:predicted phosphodiesterase